MTQARHESGSGDAIKQATHPAVVISGVERTLRTGVEAIASVLVLVEILVLFVGVAARFGFHDPIVWLDELASILFLWLAMFGSVIALQRDEHMALRAIVGRISPAKSVLVQSLVWGTTALFLLMILPSAYDYAADERLIQTPALGVHDTFRAAAVVSGVALMLLTAMSRLLRFGWRPLAVTIGILTILVVGLHFGAVFTRRRELESPFLFRNLARCRGGFVGPYRLCLRSRHGRLSQSADIHAAHARRFSHG